MGGLFTNPGNFLAGRGWGPNPGQANQGSNPTPLNPFPLTTPATPAPTQPVSPQASGSATPSFALSPTQKSAISTGAIGQLPGLIQADTGSGMTGISPSFLANQASWASGFQDQGSYIQQLVNQYLQQNPNANVQPPTGGQ